MMVDVLTMPTRRTDRMDMDGIDWAYFGQCHLRHRSVNGSVLPT